MTISIERSLWVALKWCAGSGPGGECITLTEIDEVRRHVETEELLGWSAIVDELADVLAQAATDVDELCTVVALETLEHLVVAGIGGHVELEEETEADAGVGSDVPGLVALRGLCQLDCG